MQSMCILVLGVGAGCNFHRSVDMFGMASLPYVSGPEHHLHQSYRDIFTDKLISNTNHSPNTGEQ